MSRTPSPTDVAAYPPIDSAAAHPDLPSSTLDSVVHGATSKSALKKAAKAQRYAAFKLERRAKEKAAKKEKKRLTAEKRAAGELDDMEENKRQNKRPRIQFGGKVVIDLGFDKLMNEKEITSLCSQLAYTYSANRDASYPFSILYTSLNGRTFTRLEGLSDAAYKRWVKTEWWHDGYERLWQEPSETIQLIEANSARDEVESTLGEKTVTENEPYVSGDYKPTEVQQNVVYLTADCEEELAELKPEEIYIIGGICDHNRYKNLCLNKAKESGIRTARLPISRYLASLPTRKVLTVNQVFEILLKWIETRNWEEALYSVIPKRKFQGAQTGTRGKSELVKDGSHPGEIVDKPNVDLELGDGL